MQYAIRVNEVKNKEGNIRGFATLVFGDAFKVTNIAILENVEKGQLFVAMPRYKTNEHDENGSVYKDICNPITKEFREELYGNILAAYENLQQQDKEQAQTDKSMKEAPEFSVAVTPYEREGSNIRGLARIYFGGSFIVNNISILQGKDGVFVAMPSYKTRQTDEYGKPVYQDVCYPVTKEFREKLYEEIIQTYEKEREKQKAVAKEKEGNVEKKSPVRRQKSR